MIVKKNTRKLKDRIEITTYSCEIVSANILEVEVGTTGYKGGDSGHGCRTYFRIVGKASTDIDVQLIENPYEGEGFEVTLGGDCELSTIISALEFINKMLRKQASKC